MNSSGFSLKGSSSCAARRSAAAGEVPLLVGDCGAAAGWVQVGPASAEDAASASTTWCPTAVSRAGSGTAVPSAGVSPSGLSPRSSATRYSGGSSSNSLIHSAGASLFATIVVSAPIPASIPLQRSRFVRSLFKGADSTRDGGGAGASRLETAAYRFNYQRLGPLKLLVGRGQVAEDPAGEELLDRAVEAHRGEVGRDVGLERAVLAGAVDDRGDHRVRLADLVEMRGPERVRRAGDLDDDHLHKLRLVAVGVDDERRH